MMNFLVDRESFHEALNRANKLISKVKKNLFLSPGVLLKVGDGNLTIYATDVDSWLIQDVPIYEGSDGEVFIPIKEMLSLLKNFKTPSVKVVEEESSIKIFSEGSQSQYELHKLNRDEFPEPPDYSISEGYTIDLEEFVEGLNIVGWCAAENDSRIFLNGVYVHSKNGNLNFVASDGTIFGKFAGMKFEGEFKGIIPTYMVDVVKLLDEGSAILSIENGRLYMKTTVEPVNVSLIVRLIDEEYVDYEEFIPREFVAGITANRDDLLFAVERLQPFLPETGELTFDIEKNKAIISTLSAKGRGIEEVEGETFGKISIKMLGNHLRDILKKLEYEKVDIKISGESTPIYISPSGTDEVFFLTVPLT